jgi:hypothetical protein
MKGRQHFNLTDINNIRVLLGQKINTGRKDQKRIRHKLRRVGFYISDFAPRQQEGFTVGDFDGLIQDGLVIRV